MNLTANEKNAAAARQRRYVLLLAVMLVLLFIIIVLSFWVGYYPLTPVQVLNAFYQNLVLKEILYPRQLLYSGISVCPVFCLLYLLVLPSR